MNGEEKGRETGPPGQVPLSYRLIAGVNRPTGARARGGRTDNLSAEQTPLWPLHSVAVGADAHGAKGADAVCKKVRREGAACLLDHQTNE